MGHMNQSTATSPVPPGPPAIRVTFPNLVFTDDARRQFAEVEAFLDRIEAERHPKATEIRREFIERMTSLDTYGGPVSDTDPRRRFEITVTADWAPMSFGVSWRALNLRSGLYEHFMSGGFVWHGGTNDPLTVTLVPQWWGIHT